MNERIKAIGHQAGLAFIEDGVYGQRWYSSKCGLDVSEYEKLVELIVRECLKIVEPDQTSGDEWCVTLDETAQSIRQHFGLPLNSQLPHD